MIQIENDDSYTIVMNSTHPKVQQLLLSIVYPTHPKPSLTLDEISANLKTVLKVVIKTLSSNQHPVNGAFNSQITSQYYDSIIPTFYNEFTYHVLNMASSRFVLSALLYYFDKKYIYDYIKTMIVEEFSKEIIDELREKYSRDTNLEYEDKQTSKVINIVKQLIYAFMISYDLEAIQVNLKELTTINTNNKIATINNTISESSYIVPNFIQEIIRNAETGTNMISQINNYLNRVKMKHTLPGLDSLFKPTTNDIHYKSKLETLQNERSQYHNLIGQKLIDDVSFDDIFLINRILSESTTEADKPIIEANSIFKNIYTIISKDRKFDDVVNINNEYILLTGPSMGERQYNYKNKNLINKINDPFRMFGSLSEKYASNGFWESDKSILTYTGVTAVEFSNMLLSNRKNSILTKGAQDRIKHRRRTINKLMAKYGNSPDIKDKLDDIYNKPITEFKYVSTALSPVFKTSDEKQLLLMLSELEHTYNQIKNIRSET